MTEPSDTPDPHALNAAQGDDRPAACSQSAADEAAATPEAGAKPGSDVRRLDAGLTDLTPFFPRAERGDKASAPRGRFAPLLEFGSNAAFVVCVLGFAFAAGTYFFGGSAGLGPQGGPMATKAEQDRAEMLRANQKIGADLSALKATVETLRAAVAKDQSAKDQFAGAARGREKGLDAVKAKLDAARAESGAQIADLAGKVDRLQRDPALQAVSERVDRIEKLTSSMAPTGSVAPLVKAATQDRAVQTRAAEERAEAPKRPPLITSWVVRDVYNGVALIENARGAIEVAPGDIIPGAGTVKAIERRGGGWIVITSRGLVDYDHSMMVR